MMKTVPHLSAIQCAIFSVVFLIPIFAQSDTPDQLDRYQFQKLDQQDGLPNNNIGFRGKAILQDRRGFMWFGTMEGLSRYDGYEFKNYAFNEGREDGPSDNGINCLFEDDEGYIWVGTNDGLDRFNPQSETFDRIDVDPHLSTIVSIDQDQNGKIWAVSSVHRVYAISQDGQIEKEYKQSGKNGEPSEIKGKNFVITPDGHLWFASGLGIEEYAPETDRFQLYELTDESTGNHIEIYSLLYENSDFIWAATNQGTFHFNLKNKEFTQSKLSGIETWPVKEIIKDTQNNLWFAFMHNGLARYTPSTGEVLRFNKAPDKLSSNQISTLYIDNKNQLWIGTQDGLNIINLNDSDFTFTPFQQNQNKGLGRSVDGMLVTNDDSLWLGSVAGGLAKIDSNGIVTRFDKAQYQLDSDEVVTFVEDSEGNIWFGAVNGSLKKYDAQQDSFSTFPGQKTVISLEQDQNDTLWVGTLTNGLSTFDESSQQFEIYENPLFKGKGSVTALLIDQHNNPWVGTPNGLFYFNRNDDSYVNFSNSSVEGNGKITSFVSSLHEHGNTMWVGTYDGLSRVDMKSFEVKNYDKHDGIPGNIVHAIEHDQNNNIWVAASNGIGFFNPSEEHIVAFKQNRGLTETTFTRGSSGRSKSGSIYFGSASGYTQFQPENIKIKHEAPSIYLTDFKVHNESVAIGAANDEIPYTLDRSILFKEKLILSYQESFFSFEFAAINALMPNDINYAYKLEGWNEDWIETDASQRFAGFTNIPAGNYTLKIKAENTDGFWSSDEKSIDIYISPPPWKSTTAYILYILLLIIAILAVIKLRTKQLELRTQKLENTIEDRLAEIITQKKTIEHLMQKKDELFANVSHEFRTPLTLILGPAKVLADESHDPVIQERVSPIVDNGKRLLRMVDQLLDLARLDQTHEEQSVILDVGRMWRETLRHFQSAIDEKQLVIHLELDEGVLVDISADALEKIVINLFSNAVKYSPNRGEITVECRIENNEVIISVQDQGAGIAPENQKRVFERFVRLDGTETKKVPGAGIGLALVKQLVEHHNGNIEVDARYTSGAKFVVKFPASEQPQSEVEIHSGLATQQEAQSLLSSQDEQSRAPHINQTAQAPTLTKKILVVEDHPGMRAFIHDSLKADFECILAEDGSIGAEIAIRDIPDLIVTDLMMPGKDGFEFSKIVRDDMRTSHIPIIMLTAKADLDTRKHAWESAIDEYMEKPFDAGELRIRCQNLLNIRQILSQRLGNQVSERSADPQELLSPRDRQFVEKLRAYIEENFSDAELNVKGISNALAMSESQLQRKTRALLDQNIPELVRTYRLKEGLKLLESGQSVTEAAFNVGFSNQSYFSSCFKAYFGKTPKSVATSKNEILDTST